MKVSIDHVVNLMKSDVEHHAESKESCFLLKSGNLGGIGLP